MSKKKPIVRLKKTEVNSRIEGLIEICKAKEIRLTPQRLEIYKEVAASNEHPDADTIYNRVRKRFSSISRDTVYRTLYMLEEEGLLSRVEILCERARFDANKQAHHHFICVRCGAVSDFYSSVLDKFRPPKAVHEMGTIQSAHLELRGTCTECTEIDKA